jgi:DNA replication protein DnaC
METKTNTLHSIARQLKLPGISSCVGELLLKAQHEQCSYIDFAIELLGAEISHRNQVNLLRRVKSAKLPLNHDLTLWKETHQNGISKLQLAQLRECLWLEQNFNIVLMGPSGTGKTFIAAGLCHDALLKGYRACFRTMDQLIYLMKMKDITKSAEMEFKTLLKADLLIIDDIMMFPIEKKQAVALFNLVDHFHQSASMIITTNKSPDDWVNVLDDEVLATAILDRLLYRCEIIKLVGKSFRIENRKNIFA